MRPKGKIQRNNCQYGQRRQSFVGKTSSVSLIAYLYARKIAEREVALSAGHQLVSYERASLKNSKD